MHHWLPLFYLILKIPLVTLSTQLILVHPTGIIFVLVEVLTHPPVEWHVQIAVGNLNGLQGKKVPQKHVDTLLIT